MCLVGCSVQRKNSWAGGRPRRILPVDGLINRRCGSAYQSQGRIWETSWKCHSVAPEAREHCSFFIFIFFRLHYVSVAPPIVEIWIHSNLLSVASFGDLCLFLSCNTNFFIFTPSVTQSLPGVLPNLPLSPFPCWHSKIHLSALTWIQNASLLTTRLTSSTLSVVARVSFWLSVHTPSLQLLFISEQKLITVFWTICLVFESALLHLFQKC